MKTKSEFMVWMRILIGLFILSFMYFVVADRRAPFTTEGRVHGQVVQIAPEVTSRVVGVNVRNNEHVQKGQILFELDNQRFILALEQAEISLQTAKDNERALHAQIKAAHANIAAAEATYSNASAEYQRVSDLAKKQAMSKSALDSTVRQYKMASSAVDIEYQNLEMLQSQIGVDGNPTTEVRLAKSRVKQAKIDLENTVVRASSNGVVTNLRLENGAMANAYQPLITLVSDGSLWVAADFREKSVTHVTNNFHALVTFDAYPGRIYSFMVESRDYGVASAHQNPTGTLTQIETNNRWVRDAQRTRINLKSDEVLPSSLFVGSRATMALYSGDSGFWAAIAKIRIRLISWFHFIY